MAQTDRITQHWHGGQGKIVYLPRTELEEQKVDRMEGIMDFVGYRILVPLAVALVVALIVVQAAIKVGWM